MQEHTQGRVICTRPVMFLRLREYPEGAAVFQSSRCQAGLPDLPSCSPLCIMWAHFVVLLLRLVLKARANLSPSFVLMQRLQNDSSHSSGQEISSPARLFTCSLSFKQCELTEGCFPSLPGKDSLSTNTESSVSSGKNNCPRVEQALCFALETEQLIQR